MTNRWLLDSSAVTDSTGTWNGTVSGGVTFTSGAAKFDGSTGYISLGTRTFGGAISIAFWFTVSTNSYSSVVFSFGAGVSTYSNAIEFGSNGGSSLPGGGPWYLVTSGAGTGSGTNSWNNIYPSGTYLPYDSSWIHFALTVNSVTGYSTAYINGAQVYTTNTLTSIPQTVARTLWLGRSTASSTSYFAGSISDLQLAVGYALTAGDVANLYNGVGCPAPPPPPMPPPPSPPPPQCATTVTLAPGGLAITTGTALVLGQMADARSVNITSAQMAGQWVTTTTNAPFVQTTPANTAASASWLAWAMDGSTKMVSINVFVTNNVGYICACPRNRFRALCARADLRAMSIPPPQTPRRRATALEPAHRRR